jgi:ankyrin repeat protein
MQLLFALSIASFLSSQLCAMQSQDGNANKELVKAIIDGDLKKIKQVIADLKPNVSQPVTIGKSKKLITPLGAALKKKNFNPAIVDILLAQPGVDVNQPSYYLIRGKIESYSPPLVIASMHNYQDVVKKLLDKKALVNGKENVFEKTALHYASELLDDNPSALMRVLLDHHADINAQDKYGNTPLFYADTSPAIKTLLSRGANVNAQNIGNSTPLMRAVYTKNKNKAILLLEHGADPLLTNVNGFNAFTISNDEEFTKELREYYEKLKKQMHEAARKPREPIMQKQLEALTPQQQKEAIIMPEQPALRSLIADYVCGELDAQQKEELQSEREQAQAEKKSP